MKNGHDVTRWFWTRYFGCHQVGYCGYCQQHSICVMHKHIRHRYRLMSAVQEIIEFHSPKIKYKHIGWSVPNNKAY